MRMYELQKNDTIRIGYEEFSFIKTDGAYSVLQRKSGDTIFVWAATEVERTGDAYTIKKKAKKEK